MAYTTINKSTDYFNTKLYTGNGTTNTAITGVGFQPDLSIIKARDMTYDHNVMDAVRGSTKRVATNLSDAESTQAEMIKSFASDGFNLGDNGGVNQNTKTYVAWNWKANGQGSSNTDGSINTTYTSVNTTAGFSICKWTGNATNSTIGHGLGVVPKMIIIKRLTGGTTQWVVYHVSTGNTQACYLNTTSAPTDVIGFFNDTTPTSSVFTVGTDTAVNGSGNEMIAYCFAEKQGYSKFGSYVGNGNADGTFVYTGFKPAFVMVKASSASSYDWIILDNKRDTFNVADASLYANLSNAEATSNDTDFLSNGFKLKSTAAGNNGSGTTYIYMAFAEAPLVGTNNVPCTAR
mgnify:CR=1 FL=1